nr:hypothetical protein [Rhodoferax sp.]
MKLKAPLKNKGEKLKEPPTSKTEPQYLTISLRYIRYSHCISGCDDSETRSFADKVRILTGKLWTEINGMPRHGLGFEQISRNSLQVAVPEHLTDDVNIIAFRFSGLKPMIGYRDGPVFYVLWFDRAFDCYRH